MKAWMISNFGQIPHQHQSPCISEKLMYNVVNTLEPLFVIGSSSFLQVRRTTIKPWTSSKFDQIGPKDCRVSCP